jgi:HPr kinase/phosphorylase
MNLLTIGDFFSLEKDELALQCLTGETGFEREIRQKNLHRPGLALAGYLDLFTYDRVQILGNTEISFLESIGEERTRNAIAKVMTYDIPCIVVTDSNPVPPSLVEQGVHMGIPVFSSSLGTTEFTHLVSDFLDEHFAPTVQMHGTLVDVYGTGLLLTGKSGIGKSEVALDLVERGHRLVADDVVTITRKADSVLIGRCNETLNHLMEIRGLGIIDVKEIFGVHSIRMQKRVEMIVELRVWQDRDSFERTGLDKAHKDVLGIDVPHVQLPIFPGKNITVICETLALNLHLQVYGYDAAEELNRRLLRSMQDKQRLRNYLRRDSE